MQRIVGQIRKAVDAYNMIDDGDRVAVGISGGKDSLVLAASLALLSRYYPKKFEVVGITIDMGYESDYSDIKEFCREYGIEYHVKYTKIKEIVFDERKESNPCSLCSKMRRGALNEYAKELGCGKVALGHHNDDVLDTFMLSLLYEGRVNTFSPVTVMTRSGITQIRPLIYVREYEVKAIVRERNVPVLKSPCPADGETKRADMQEIIEYLGDRSGRGIRKRLFHAVSQLPDWKIEKK